MFANWNIPPSSSSLCFFEIKLSAGRICVLTLLNRKKPGPEEFEHMEDPSRIGQILNPDLHRTVLLWSSDKVEFEVDKEVASEFEYLRHMLDRRFEDPPLHLNRIHSTLLGDTLKYCEYHVRTRKQREAKGSPVEVIMAADKAWDSEFINKIDRTSLFALLEISLEWKIDGLQNLTLSTIVNQIYDGAKQES